MAFCYKAFVVFYRTVGIRTLDNRAEIFTICTIKQRPITNNEFYPLPCCAGLHDAERIRENLAVHKHFAHVVLYLFARAQITHHRYCLCGCCCFVQKRAVGKWQTRQVRYHRLIHKQRLQTTLTHFGLIRRIRSIPHGVLKHVTLNNRRSDSPVPAATDKGFERQILLRHRRDRIQMFLLGKRFVQV